MINEERDNHIGPGKVGEFVACYRYDGVGLQKNHLGTFVCYFTKEIGELNHVVAIWGYDSLVDRAAPSDHARSPRTAGLLLTRRRSHREAGPRTLTPTVFSPLQ
ncbi:NIPSNAP family protein [Aurantimonas sp. A2-1-M11]|uniref:NIPSNAP family protein n=1 Tax=Aurantimonas sp. A2-1-M11 TaxID=3113712 RepID=UPI002F926EBC